MEAQVMRSSRLMLISAACAAALVATACGSSGGSSSTGNASSDKPTGTVSLGYAGGGNIDTYYKEVVKAAKTALPGIKVKLVAYSTYDDQLNQMPQQFAAKTIPDVIVWDNSAPVKQYAEDGAIRSLDNNDPQIKATMAEMPPALAKAWTIDGKLYGVPSYLQNSAFVSNLSLLKTAGVATPPVTMQQVAQDAKILKEKTGKAGLVILDNLFHLSQYVYAFGGGWGSGKTIDSPQNRAGLQFLVNLFNSGVAATPNQLGATWDGEAIGKNAAALSDGGPWYIGFMKASAPKVAYSLSPVPPGTNGAPFVVTYGGAYSITSNAGSVAAAAALIKYLTNDASEKAIITSDEGFVPALTKYIQQYRAATPQYKQITDSLLGAGKVLDYPLKTVQFGNALVAGFENIVFKHSGSVSSLLSNLQSQYGS
jgi:multiple sugar transport system substrate-binding protein